MFFWVGLPGEVDTMALLPRAVACGMAFVPGAACYAGPPARHTLRLSFGTVPPEQIDLGIRRFAQTLSTPLEPTAP